jgi:hypothetical protein
LVSIPNSEQDNNDPNPEKSVHVWDRTLPPKTPKLLLLRGELQVLFSSFVGYLG